MYIQAQDNWQCTYFALHANSTLLYSRRLDVQLDENQSLGQIIYYALAAHTGFLG